MTTRRELLAAAALLGPLSLATKTARAAEDHKKTGQEARKMADFLFVQNARGASPLPTASSPSRGSARPR